MRTWNEVMASDSHEDRVLKLAVGTAYLKTTETDNESWKDTYEGSLPGFYDELVRLTNQYH